MSKKYANDLAKAIDWERYVRLVAAIGNQLNDRKNRFDKSDIIEKSIEEYSGGRFKWVDLEGRDHYDTKNKKYIEFKYVENAIFTPKKKSKAIVKVKLKNSLGKNKGVTINHAADFYMIAQQDAVAVISLANIKPYLVSVPDGIEAHIPFDKLQFVLKPNEVSQNRKVKSLNYSEMKHKMQMELIRRV